MQQGHIGLMTTHIAQVENKENEKKFCFWEARKEMSNIPTSLQFKAKTNDHFGQKGHLWWQCLKAKISMIALIFKDLFELSN